jgi:hypothetical protein
MDLGLLFGYLVWKWLNCSLITVPIYESGTQLLMNVDRTSTLIVKALGSQVLVNYNDMIMYGGFARLEVSVHILRLTHIGRVQRQWNSAAQTDSEVCTKQLSRHQEPNISTCWHCAAQNAIVAF